MRVLPLLPPTPKLLPEHTSLIQYPLTQTVISVNFQAIEPPTPLVRSAHHGGAFFVWIYLNDPVTVPKSHLRRRPGSTPSRTGHVSQRRCSRKKNLDPHWLSTSQRLLETLRITDPGKTGELLQRRDVLHGRYGPLSFRPAAQVPYAREGLNN